MASTTEFEEPSEGSVLNLKDFLTLVVSSGNDRINYFVVCPDNLGLNLLLPKALYKIAAKDDVVFVDATSLTKDKARQLEKEARKAPVGLSNFTFFFVAGLQNLPVDSVGPLLKVVEEAKYSCFIFQAQFIPKRVSTLLSRSMLVKLPFMSRRQVLGNLQALHYDAKLADELKLYDGTLNGTIKALATKDTVASIQREMKRGSRGYVSLYGQDMVGSLAFRSAVDGLLDETETSFLKRDDNEERRRLVVLRHLLRNSQ